MTGRGVLLLSMAAAVAVAGGAWYLNRARPEPTRHATGPRQVEAAPATAGGTWRVPELSEESSRVPSQAAIYPAAGDPRYADYQEMLRQPMFQSSLRNSPGYKDPPYDPEWRSVLSGRREVAPHDLGLAPGGETTLDMLAEQVVFALRNSDQQVLLDLRVLRAEFVEIFWPEFPQSRPYLRIPPNEAWGFHMAKLNEGTQSAYNEFGGRDLDLETVQAVSVQEFTNFRLIGVRITALDRKSGESLEITGEQGGTVVECRGSYKVYLYQN